MPNRDILAISQIVLSWFKNEKGEIIIEHLRTKRKVFLYESKLIDLWEILAIESDFDKIRNKYCLLYSEMDLLNSLKLLKKAGLVRIYYKSRGK